MFNSRIISVTLASILLTINGCSTVNKKPQVSHSETHLSSTNPATEQEDLDEDYLTILGLMKGHLIVAKELLDEGKSQQAEPHVGHPIDELYGDMESQLSTRKVPEFKTTLIKLQELIKNAPKNPQLKTQYEASIKAIDQAILALPETKRQDPEFILSVINRLLKTAAREYHEGVSQGKITEVIEYQDSRGFVLYADSLYQTIAPQMQQKHPEVHQKMMANLAKLKTVWISVNPPKAAVMTPEEVSQLVKKIKAENKL